MPVPVRSTALALALAACGGDSGPSVEVVVSDATIGGAAPRVIGATSDTVSWTASPGPGTTHVAGASLAKLPATGSQLAMATGPVAHAGDTVVFGADMGIARVGLDGAVMRLTTGSPEALAGSAHIVAWTAGAVVSWGPDDVQKTATLGRIDSCDHLRITARHIYVAADGSTGRRLYRIERNSAMATGVTSSSTWAAMFPAPLPDGATLRGRIAAADDDGALWLVEDMPTGRAIVVSQPLQGDAVVLLEHVRGATGFFAAPDTLYWQEGDELLTAPRGGGAASIFATLPGPAGALADGYVYFVDGNAIKRMRVE